MVLILNILIWHEVLLLPDGKLHVHFLDVGQGDATLIVTPNGKQIVIDGGPNVRALEHLGTYMPFFDRTIENLVLTHPDADHLTALPDILERYTVASITLAGTEKHTARYQSVLHQIETKNIPIVWSNPNLRITSTDGVALEMIWPDAQSSVGIKNANDASVTLMLHYGDVRILFPGDIEEWAEKEILASGKNIAADILKVPHHGSRTSSSTGFLLAVQPTTAIVSAGADNRFGHPHPDVVQRYESMGIPIRNTAVEGTISLEIE